MLLVEIDSRLTWFDLTADGGRYAAPRALDLGEIFGNRTDRAVLLDQLGNNVIEGIEQALVNLNIPVTVRHDVVTGAGLSFRRRGQFVFLALGGDVVDVHIDLVLLAPFLANLIERLVGSWYPMVPTTQRQCTCGIDAANIRRGNRRCRTESSGLENSTTRKT